MKFFYVKLKKATLNYLKEGSKKMIQLNRDGEVFGFPLDLEEMIDLVCIQINDYIRTKINNKNKEIEKSIEK